MITQNLLDIIESSSLNNEYFINNQKYIINILFLSPDGSFFPISKNNVTRLELFDNIVEPFNKGLISFVNNDNSFERLKTNKEKTEFNPELDILKGYNYRGDGRDFVFIQIIPEENVNEPFGVNTDDYNKVYGYRNLFVCENNNESVEGENKIITFNLMDFNEKVLSERKSFFSSANLIVNEKPVFTLSNKERQVKTGICIKNLLKDVLKAEDLNQIIDVDPETEETLDFEDGLGEIFYTSPSNNNALDDLMYLYSKHVSNNSSNDFSFLKRQNFTNKFTLKSCKDLFEKAYNSNDSAGLLNYEKIVVTGTNDDNSLIQNSKKVPLTIASFGELSEVKEIKFFNTDSIINSENLVTEALYSYNFDNKTFNLDKKDSDIENVKKVFTDNYVNNMKGFEGKPFPSFLLNKTKSENLSFKNQYSLYGENINIRKSEGINKLLKSGLISNIGAEIILKGQIFRKTGTFLSLDREGQYVDNLFDDKFLGIYFIANVEHVFVDDINYYNRIIVLKTYINKSHNIGEDNF